MTDMKRETDRPMPDVVGILPLRGTVLFPQAVVPLGAGRVSSLRLIEEAVQGGRLVGAVTQKDPKDDAPGADGLHSVGTLTVIHKALKQPDGSLRLIAQGVGRFRLVEIVQTEPYLKARIEPIEEQSPAQDLELEALVRSVTSLFAKVVSLSPTLPDELVAVLDNVEGPGAVAPRSRSHSSRSCSRQSTCASASRSWRPRSARRPRFSSSVARSSPRSSRR